MSTSSRQPAQAPRRGATGYDDEDLEHLGQCALAAGALAVGASLGPLDEPLTLVHARDGAGPELRELIAKLLTVARRDTPDRDAGNNILSFELQKFLIVDRDLPGDDNETVGHFVLVFPRQTELAAAEELAQILADLAVRLRGLRSARLRAELDGLSEMRRADRFRRQSELDQLTRLDNGTSFRNKVEAFIDAAEQDFALVLIDIDDFKSINDLYGHSYGDRYLRQVAAMLVQTFPMAPATGRLGGDEFGLLLPLAPLGQLEEKSLRALTEKQMARLSGAVQRADARTGRRTQRHVSMGAAIGRIHSVSYDRLFEMADAALYSRKGPSASKSGVFVEREHDCFSLRLLEPMITKALANGEIAPAFQPLIDMRRGTIHGYEALMRWDDPVRGVLTPDRFKGVLRSHDLAPQVTHRICTSALQWLANRRTFQGAGDEIVSINLTQFDLLNHDFVFDLEKQLGAVGLGWTALVLEVTEDTVLSAATGNDFRALSEFRSRGARIALDDFGTGYGGLSHLVDWPVDLLKIDRSFVMGLTPGTRRAKIVKGMVDMGHDLGFEIVAEGIDTAAACQFLAEIGCDYGQGYLFSAPQAGAQFDALPPARWRDLVTPPRRG